MGGAHPFAHRLLIRYAGAASLLHALNHVYDDAQAAVPVTHLLTDALPLVVFAVLLILTSLGEPSGGVAPLPAKAGRREAPGRARTGAGRRGSCPAPPGA